MQIQPYTRAAIYMFGSEITPTHQTYGARTLASLYVLKRYISHYDMCLGQLVPPEAIPVVCLASNGVFLLIECHLNVHLAALFVICLACACRRLARIYSS